MQAVRARARRRCRGRSPRSARGGAARRRASSARAVRARDDDPVVRRDGSTGSSPSGSIRISGQRTTSWPSASSRATSGSACDSARVTTILTVRATRARVRARPDRRRCGARATRRPRPRSAPVSVVPSWCAATGARQPPPTAAMTARSASTRRRVSSWSARGDEMRLARAHLQRERALRGLGQQLLRVEAKADLVRRGRAGRGRTPRARSRRAPARRASAGACRCCRGAARSRASARARAVAPSGARTPCRCACPAAIDVAPHSASRGSSRATYAPTSRPSGSVDVMSFAECTATSIRCSSSASSSSFTNTPREPISPNGFERSRSPAVVIGTSAISIPGARRCDAASSACVSASRLPRLPTRISTARPAPDGLPARRDAAGPNAHERCRHLQRQRTSRQLAELQRSSSPRPNRCRTASA